MTTIRVHIETPTDSFSEDYPLSESEQVEWNSASAAERDKWIVGIGETAFYNACSYGTEVVE